MKSAFIAIVALTYSLAAFSKAPAINCKTDVENLALGDVQLVAFIKVTTTNLEGNNTLLVQSYFGETVETAKSSDGLGYAINVGEITKNDDLTLVSGKGTPGPDLGDLDFELELKDKKASLLVTLEQFGKSSILSELDLTCE